MSIMKLHELKNHWRYFQEVWDGNKTFEVRENDRKFKKNDLLLLRNYNPEREDKYDGKAILCKITYILDNPEFVKEGFIVMSIKILTKYEWLK